MLQSFWIVRSLQWNLYATKLLFLLESQWSPPTYRAVDCVSLQAWLGWRRVGWGRAGLAIRPMSQSGNIKRAANPHLAPITVSCPSHRPISSHYRPMWIPGKFLRPNLFNPIVPIWPGSFSVSLITVINKKTKYWMVMSTTSMHWYVSLLFDKSYMAEILRLWKTHYCGRHPSGVLGSLVLARGLRASIQWTSFHQPFPISN